MNQTTKDAVTREQIEARAKLAGMNQLTELGLERLGDFAIFARQDRTSEVAQAPIYQVMVDGKWVDSTAAEYAAVSNQKRIVYAAPVAPTPETDKRDAINGSPCIVWPGNKNKAGYGQLGRRRKMYLAHRLVYCDHNNVSIESVKDLVVRHACDNPGCINPWHLLIGTHADNTKDKVDRGRHPTKERNGSAKLNSEKAAEIRALYASGACNVTIAWLARKYGVVENTIKCVVQNKTWKPDAEKA